MTDTLYNNSLSSSVIFSNADENTIFNSDSTLYKGTLLLSTTSNDPNLAISFTETTTQADTETNTAASITLVSTVSTTDTNVKIVSTPTINNSSVSITSTASESTVDGKFVTVVTTVFSVSDVTLYAYIESISTSDSKVKEVLKLRYLIMRYDLIQPYLHGSAGNDDMMYCADMFTTMNISVVKMTDVMYQTLRHSWGKEKIYELDAEAAIWGTQFFGEIRAVAKVWEAKTPWYGEKTPTEITPEIQAHVVNMMRKFAYEIIGIEYERRYLEMRDSNELEVATWEIQKHEAREWLDNQGENGSKTPFLDYIAIELGKDKTELANSILVASEDYEDRLSTMLVEMKILLAKFKACNTIWDLNILYEDYFGIQMPIKQAIALGRAISETDWTRKPEWKIKGNGYYF